MRLRNWPWLALFAALLAAPVYAQQSKTQESKPANTPEAKFLQIQRDYQAAQRELIGVHSKLAQELKVAEQEKDQDKAQKIREGQKKITAEEYPKLLDEYATRYTRLADEQPKTPVAARALAAAVQLLQRDPSKLAKAKKRLLDDHLNDDALAEAVWYFRSDKSFLSEIEKSKSRLTLATVLYLAAQQAKGRELTDANAPTVLPLLERLQKEYGDVQLVYPGGRPGPNIGLSIAGELNEFRNLRIGKVAPDIAGEDVDGVKFKLTDYRGKVVVIDFWGDW